MISFSGSPSRRAWSVFMLLSLAACRSTPDCDSSDAPYLKAQDRNVVQVPDGLAQPDRSQLLAVPQRSKSERNAAKTACLDRPPSYFGTAGRLAASPEEMIADWAQAWADRNGEAVVSMYSQDFAASEGGAGVGQRREEVTSGPLPNARLENVRIAAAGTDRQTATFVQRFGANAVRKELTLKRENGVWKILSERVITVPKP